MSVRSGSAPSHSQPRGRARAVPSAAGAERGLGERRSTYLHPGAIVVSAEPCAITTILGSCVSVCLYDIRRGVGGANHYLLPHFAAGGQASPRYGNAAVSQLVAQLLALGCRRPDLRAKVFGGACVIEAFAATPDHVGSRNARSAVELLEQERIAIVEDDLGGSRGRRLVFHTDDGSARVNLI